MVFECPICYRSRRKIITLQCQHQVCFFCWQQWSNKELQFYRKEWPTCPSCREPQVPFYLQKRFHSYLTGIGLFLLWLYADQWRDSFS